MTGTLAGALAARKIPTQPDKLVSEAEGFIENVDGKPLITRIKVHYTVRVPRGKREDAQRAIKVHEKGCPASQSVQRGIKIEWDGEVVEEEPVP
jgi:organic hydroperoxide reductase OsmC/OhrA